MSLGSKTLFVTGASRGIGLAIALRAARDGANITIAAKTVKPDPRLPGTIFTAAEEIEKAGGKALPLPCDIRDGQSVAKAVLLRTCFITNFPQWPLSTSVLTGSSSAWMRSKSACTSPVASTACSANPFNAPVFGSAIRS